MKKVALFFCVIMLFSFSCAAAESVTLSPGEGFLVLGRDDEALLPLLHLTKEECAAMTAENGMVYLAADRENQRQIRVTVFQDGFSETVGQLSLLSDEKITALIPDLTGERRGDVICSGKQKFIRQQLRLQDSGGDYILTRFFTVAGKKNYVLSFYTAAKADAGYIEDVFSTYSSPDFLQEEKASGAQPGLRVLLPVLIAVFGVISVVIVFTLIRDIQKEKRKAHEEEDRGVS